MERLEAFEAMMNQLVKQAEEEKARMDELKALGREKSATYRQYMGNRLLYSRMIEMYKQYGLLEQPNRED